MRSLYTTAVRAHYMTSGALSACCTVTLAVFLVGCGGPPDYEEACRELARSIEANGRVYRSVLASNMARTAALPKGAKDSDPEVRKLYAELEAARRLRRSFLRGALFGSADSPLRCGCGGGRFETLQAIAKQELASLGDQVDSPVNQRIDETKPIETSVAYPIPSTSNYAGVSVPSESGEGQLRRSETLRVGGSVVRVGDEWDDIVDILKPYSFGAADVKTDPKNVDSLAITRNYRINGKAYSLEFRRLADPGPYRLYAIR